MDDGGFAWDEDKRQRNIVEHGVDFRRAARMFRNPVVEAEDKREDYGETRFRAVGRAEDEYYMVVYTWRGGQRRIISAWRLGENGKRRYQAILARRA